MSHPTNQNGRPTTTDPGDRTTAPDDAGKPESPSKLTKPSWKYIARKTLREFSDDQCTDLAAALTYYAVLALFPALLALVSLLGLFGQQGKTEELIGVLSEMGAGSVADTISKPLQELTENSSAGLALVIGIAGALWSASGYVGAFGRAMNRIYEIREGRPFWKLRPLMIVITLAAVILAGLVAIGLVVSGALARAIGGGIGTGRAAGPRDRRRHRAGRDRGRRVEHRQMAGAAGVGRVGGRDPVLRDTERAATEVPVVPHRRRRRHHHLGGRVGVVRPVHLAVLQLQQDLRVAGRGDHFPVVVVDHQPGVAVRRGTGRRNGTRPATAGRHPRRA